MRILCGGAQCGEYLGDVGASPVGLKTGPVWFIRPGWHWVFPPGVRGQPLGSAILERADDTRRSERQLLHAVYIRGARGGGAVGLPPALVNEPRVGVAREANLPIVVRCPKCHRLRYVPADVVTRAVQPVERRLVQIVRS